MHVEANRSPYLNPAERVRGAQRTQQPEAAGRTDFARHAEAARPASPVRPTPLAAEGLASGGVGQPPTPRLGDAGGFRPPELIAARYEGQDRSLTPEGGLRSGGAGSHGLRPDTEDLPRGLRQLVEVQAMSQPDVLGRGGRLDLTI
ncbi:MAG: hypothetical protein LLP51_09825 [Halorhodospira halophila]|uniref:hypothetical protein n=1 Tax=Halorhodospira TaxID=85108 RepID=UPI001EE801D8|nr:MULTISPECIES: hypothetical protein [Halorhodospira]MCC3751680.1 hypothetical protein [Halorhodospira halophila]MCG5526796.1 hypothetical protein [Halorhodospira halophila]MCG5533352.1 hypothetical protein [Halorhodospira sp. 9621]MCG5537811.1 hypothetical protein [Halorhodospira sp. 9622]MCG5542867.1 hypothetical protein [Halorhodospira sp. 9628]